VELQPIYLNTKQERYYFYYAGIITVVVYGTSWDSDQLKHRRHNFYLYTPV